MLKAIAQLKQYPKQAFGRTLFLLSARLSKPGIEHEVLSYWVQSRGAIKPVKGVELSECRPWLLKLINSDSSQHLGFLAKIGSGQLEQKLAGASAFQVS